ncbi:Trimethylamine-N-oxide reductase [Trichinella spiralis]
MSYKKDFDHGDLLTVLKSAKARIYGERGDHMTVMRLLYIGSQKLSIRKDGTDTKVLDCQEDLETIYCQDLMMSKRITSETSSCQINIWMDRLWPDAYY